MQWKGKVSLKNTAAEKCVRCWHFIDDVGSNPQHPEICGRCVSNLSEAGEVALLALRAAISTRTLLWFAIAAAVLLLDQLTKLWIVSDFVLGERRTVTGFFNLVRAHNEGAAFSFLSDAGGWQRWFFTILAIAISTVLVVWISRLPRYKINEGLALALILGGAPGNLYDRLTLGYVVDFLDFHWSGTLPRLMWRIWAFPLVQV